MTIALGALRGLGEVVITQRGCSGRICKRDYDQEKPGRKPGISRRFEGTRSQDLEFDVLYIHRIVGNGHLHRRLAGHQCLVRIPSHSGANKSARVLHMGSRVVT